MTRPSLFLTRIPQPAGHSRQVFEILKQIVPKKKILLRRIAAKCKRNAAHTGNFKEGAPIHIKKDLPKHYIGIIIRSVCIKKCELLVKPL